MDAEAVLVQALRYPIAEYAKERRVSGYAVLLVEHAEAVLVKSDICINCYAKERRLSADAVPLVEYAGNSIRALISLPQRKKTP